MSKKLDKGNTDSPSALLTSKQIELLEQIDRGQDSLASKVKSMEKSFKEQISSLQKELAEAKREMKPLKVGKEQSTEGDKEDEPIASGSGQNTFPSNVPIVDTLRKLHELPSFSGKAEEWPMFATTFEETTKVYRYTKLENMMRLQKSLRGEAREEVECLLIHPDNVDEVIEQLKFKYGRPERLVKIQIEKVREIQIINENQLDRLVPFATKVKNLTIFLDVAKASRYLNNPALLDELVSKLPMSKKLEWAQQVIKKPESNIRDFSNWIQDVAKLIMMVSDCTNNQSRPNKSKNVLHAVENKQRPLFLCCICKQNHRLSDCQMFLKMSSNDKWEVVKKNRLCFCCLYTGHNVSDCRRRKVCDKDGCKRRHHVLLHDDNNIVKTTVEPTQPVLNFSIENEKTRQKVLFRVIPVKLYGQKKEITTYALLDEGSAITMIDQELANELGLRGRRETLKLQWLNNHTETKLSEVIELNISGVKKGHKKYGLENVHAIAGMNLPLQSLDMDELSDKYKHLKNLPVVSYTNARPKILIGADNAHLGIQKSIKPTPGNKPVVANTPLGWVVYGQLYECNNEANYSVLFSNFREDNKMDNIQQIVTDYFKNENFGVTESRKQVESEENIRAKSIMEGKTKRVGERFETGLLWKKDVVNMPDSLPLAVNRLKSLENKMEKNPDFAVQYKNKITEYIEKGYAKKLSKEEAERISEKTWYLPHFAVINPKKPDKIRMVFDAAARIKGTSLNDVLLPGPDLNQPLITILFKFRQAAIGVCADIKEMFHQIQIVKNDQDAQRFLWREDSKLDVDTYVMQVMTFGATCSPCLAQYIKNRNAMEYKQMCPAASDAIIESHYVDDYVQSFSSEEEAIKVAKEVKNIHSLGGFELRNFMSNSRVVMKALSDTNNQADDNISLVKQMDKDERILGMFWGVNEDEFQFHLKFHHIKSDVLEYKRKLTKRELLSLVMSIFDPFGFLSNILLYGKIILQDVWKCGINWDEQLPDEIYDRWKQWDTELKLIKNLKVPRCYSPKFVKAKEIQLHIFVDASECAYTAVAYWCIIIEDQNIETSFVAAKTRCAPQKFLSVPRLELQAAVLGIRLKNMIIEGHSVKVDKCILWSDSKTVINWVRSDLRQYKPFVAHRIAEILESSTVKDWKWLPSKLNVADDATRAKFPVSFVADSRWIKGPEFLRMGCDHWPAETNITTNSEHLQEVRPKCRKILHVLQKTIIMPDINRFSKYERLLRATAWMFRVVRNCDAIRGKNQVQTGELTVDEIDKAETYLCKSVQQSTWSKDYEDLVCKNPLDKDSPIFQLSPYMDEEGVIRIKGRIDAATTIPFAARRPIIMPKKHKLTKLIIDYYHRKICHQNHETVICQIRQKFWVPHIRCILKEVCSKCQMCKIRKAQPQQPIMGSLPPDRVTPYVNPFTYTGLDFFGPVNVAVGRRHEKRWVALFTCLTVRAIHLELASDLSTDACIICIRNFINRRGKPIRIRSDNGTNFVGIEKELRNVTDFIDDDKMRSTMSTLGIEWVFNCPGNPSSGGSWERMVQSVKRVLSHTLKEAAPRPETLYSLLIEAENIVNSRPLTHIPISPEDEEPLTPNHFLIGKTNSTQIPKPFDKKLMCLRKQWRIAQQLKNCFWKRWVLEYLPEMTRRTKWYKNVKPISVGDIVLVIDVDSARSQWCKARVTAVFPAKDGVVRIAEVKTSKGITLRRPVSKLAILDVRSDNISQSPGRFTGGGMSGGDSQSGESLH